MLHWDTQKGDLIIFLVCGLARIKNCSLFAGRTLDKLASRHSGQSGHTRLRFALPSIRGPLVPLALGALDRHPQSLE